LQLFPGIRDGPGGDGRDFGRIHLHAVLTDNVPQKENGGGKELALHKQRVLQKALEHSLNMFLLGPGKIKMSSK